MVPNIVKRKILTYSLHTLGISKYLLYIHSVVEDGEALYRIKNIVFKMKGTNTCIQFLKMEVISFPKLMKIPSPLIVYHKVSQTGSRHPHGERGVI